MSFSFKYKPIKLNSGRLVFKPMVPITFNGVEKIDVLAILDSGSDMAIIPKELAEILGLNYSEEEELSGITGPPIKVGECKLEITFGKNRESYNLEIPVLVPQSDENVPIIIGRIGFSEHFKITFSELEEK
ncbi:hypothetical protein COV15_00570 [Candidatus Woesearchaeota archaeon CG10_big_fil_rev_8_21_14_0_10_34_12]|nr:MAG: hypothetical protein COV15_00570 [Candidatus Woesearchaeota archaeon CG10_big_fil_rev_8_21_14_0_10_34_12]